LAAVADIEPVPDPSPPLSDADRQLALDVVRNLVAVGKLDLVRFEETVDTLINARTEQELATAMRGLPSPIAFTPAERRARETVRIERQRGHINLAGSWQLGRETIVRSGMGHVTVDLCDAEFDAWDTELDVHAEMGMVTVIVPRGLAVQVVVGGEGAGALQRALPGSPIVRLRATSAMGSVTIRHPVAEVEKPPKRRFRLGRKKKP
jgi:hypothetical protein